MKERPLLFSGPMVRATLAGTKTQTRRVVKPQPDSDEATGACWLEIDCRHQWAWHSGEDEDILPNEPQFYCPYGQPGDRLWVREAWARTSVFPGFELVIYREGDSRTDYGGPWKPGIHMFRRDSRITLEVTDVRVERLQDISIEDCKSEGAWGPDESIVDKVAQHFGIDILAANPYLAYRMLWESINGPGSWEANPWVWVVEFKKI